MQPPAQPIAEPGALSPGPSFDQRTDAALLTLRHALSAHGTRSLGILLDPAAGPLALEIPPELECQVYRVPVHFQDLDESLAPRLLWIDDEEALERVVNASVRLALRECINGEPRTCCAWILVDDDPATSPSPKLVAHLASAVVHPDAQGRQRLVRWFDPRVCALLRLWMSPAQWRRLLGPARVWMSLDAEGQMHSLLRDDSAPALAPASPVFSRDDWLRLARIGWLQQALLLAPQWALPHLGAQERAAAIDGVLARAQTAGLKAEDDALVFAACALTLHPRFDEHPLAAQALVSAAGPSSTSFAQAVSSWAESTFEQIAEGGWLAPASRS